MTTVGPGREAWEKFCATATPDERLEAFVALIEQIPGERGLRIRAAYKVGGYPAARDAWNAEEDEK